MPLSLDGSAHSTIGSAVSLAVTLTTANANDIICIFAMTNGGPIVSVTSTNLTFTRKATFNSLDLWYAIASSPLSSEVITVNVTTSNFISIDAFGVSGADTATIWDGAAVTGSPDPLVISTSNANTMVIASYREGTQGTPTAGSGFIQISGANFLLSEYQVYSSPQTSLSVTQTTGATDANGGIVIAIKQASATAVPQIGMSQGFLFHPGAGPMWYLKGRQAFPSDIIAAIITPSAANLPGMGVG